MSTRTQLATPNPEFAPLMATLLSKPLPWNVSAAREVFKTTYIEGVKAHFGPTLPAGADLLRVNPRLCTLDPDPALDPSSCLSLTGDTASEYRVQDHQVPVGGQARILARCVVPTPANARGKTFPLLVWYHAGGTNGLVSCVFHYRRVDRQVSSLVMPLWMITFSGTSAWSCRSLSSMSITGTPHRS